MATVTLLSAHLISIVALVFFIMAMVRGEAGVVVIGDGAGGYAHNAAIHVVTPTGKLVSLFGLERYREALAFAWEVKL